MMTVSERWFRLLLRFYPADFRDEMGDALVEAYRDRAQDVLRRGGTLRLAAVCVRALADSLRNGVGERLRPAISWRRSGDWGRDVEHAIRRLRRAPTLVLSTVATLGVGLGLSAVVYTVVQRVLIDPMPYKDPDDLYYVWRDYGPIADLKRGMLAGTDVVELQKAGGVIEQVVGLGRQLNTFSIGSESEPIEIPVMFTSPALFDLLGVPPALGRGFAAHEVGPGVSSVMVLTHELWNRLGADPEVIGREVRLNNRPYQVIGVLPRGFVFARNESAGPPQPADAFIPFRVLLEDANPRDGSYAGLIRARRGTTPEQLAAAVEAVGRTVDRRDFHGRGLRLYPVGLKSDLVAGVRPALVALALGGVFLVLAVMVNLASVLLARTAQREQELAVSRALGASGAAVARATLFEGALLGLGGGGVAALGAFWATRALVALAPLDLPRREAIAVDGRIAGVAIAAGALIGLLAALAPATWAARASLSSLLASSAVRGGGGHGRLRRGMVVTQVALSLVLLAAGGLVVRSFERLLRVDPGFRPEGVLSLWVRMPPEFFPEGKDVVALQDRIEQELAALPGVSGASATSVLPFSPRALPAFHAASSYQTAITFPGAPGNTGDADRDAPLVDLVGARPTYFDVMGIRLLAGRGFDPARREDEALIDGALARQFFPTTSPIGAEVRIGDRPLTIVGVVRQPRLYDVHQDGRPQLFVRAEGFVRHQAFVLRTDRDPRALIPDVRLAIRRIDPRLVAAQIRPMGDLVGHSLRRQHISAVLLSAFALGALLLAAMGLYGVVAGAVMRRRHELALRMAVGADHRALLRLVLREGASLVMAGVLMGAPGIYFAGRVIRGVLLGVTPLDPLTLTSVAVGLGLVTMLACYVPARRVLGIDPAQLLRRE
jgi:putative ABC transport system permease protein